MSRQRGQQAEDHALAYLQRQGLVLQARNFHTRFGELDLVMLEGSVWVCVEVKARASRHHGQASEFVTPAKQQRLRIAFEQYVQSQGHNPNHTPMRMDVIALDNNNLQWIKNIA